jgi:putative two-component system response regulator
MEQDDATTALPHTPLALVVDDDPYTLEAVAGMLEQLGLRSLGRAESDGVLEWAARHDPAVILLDIMMPDVDGYTIATHLRGDSRTAAIPIVFITGQDAPIYRTLSYGMGAIAHIQKPFTLTTLRAAVGVALAE